MTRLHFFIYFLAHALLLTVGLLIFRASQDELWKAVGASVIAAGIAGMVVFLYVLATTRTSDLLEAFSSAGLRTVFSSRSVLIRKQYDDRLKSASRQLDVIGFGLSYIREE